MNEQLAKYKQLYTESLNKSLKEGTIRVKLHHVDLLLGYIEQNNILDLYKFDINIIYRFVNSLTYASQTKSTLQFTIREFFDCLYRHSQTSVKGRQIYPVIRTNKRERIPSFYLCNEVKELIDSIDIRSGNGVRDKCMILMAAQLGFRSSDILTLTFENILWDKDVIYKIQMKTGNLVTTALPENIKYLLIDYIKNYRPPSESSLVFICEQTGERFSSSEIYAVVNKYLKKTGIPVKGRKHGPHALRHSLATSLLKDNTPMHVITGILGHKNTDSTNAYLSVDIESLRELCLEVPTDEE